MELAVVTRFVGDMAAAGGIVYGPAPRDLLLAQVHARGYAEVGGLASAFGDPTVLPQFWARARAPAEVHVCVRDEDRDAFDAAIRRSLLDVRVLPVPVPTPYGSEPPRAARYRVGLARREVLDAGAMLSSLHPDIRDASRSAVASFAEDMRRVVARSAFTLDVVYGDAIPRVDFDVDALCLSTRGLWLSPVLAADLGPMDVHRRFTEVLDAVASTRAAFLGESAPIGDPVRFASSILADERWTVPLRVATRVEGRVPYDGYCIICHDTMGGGDAKDHYKLGCCDARYHAECLRRTAPRMYGTRACIMCRKAVHPMSLFVDLCVIFRGSTLHSPSADAYFDGEVEGESDDYDDMPPLMAEDVQLTSEDVPLMSEDVPLMAEDVPLTSED